MAEARIERRLVAILAADVAGYSRLMSADETGTLSALQAHRCELIAPAIERHRGRIVIRARQTIETVSCATMLSAELRLDLFSKTASIGPSDKMLPWLLREGAYKLEALPPSRNKALGQFSPSRNRRAKASNDTSP